MKVKKWHKFNRDESYLKTFMHTEVVDWLMKDTKALLTDFAIIKRFSRECAVKKLHDYSYIMMPAIKAFAATLNQIGRELKVRKFKTKTSRFRNMLPVIYYEKVLDKIDALSGKSKHDDITRWATSANGILKYLRHTPKNFMGKRKTQLKNAITSGLLIVDIISELCYAMIKAGMFPSVRKAQEERARLEKIRKKRQEAALKALEKKRQRQRLIDDFGDRLQEPV